MADKKSLSERDICSKYITPAITASGWDLHAQIREEVSFTKGRIIVRGNTSATSYSARQDQCRTDSGIRQRHANQTA